MRFLQIRILHHLELRENLSDIINTPYLCDVFTTDESSVQLNWLCQNQTTFILAPDNSKSAESQPMSFPRNKITTEKIALENFTNSA